MNWSYSFWFSDSAAVVSDSRRLGGLVYLRVGHELVVLFLVLGLCGRGLGLQTREVGLDHLHHTYDATVLRTHPPVGLLVEDCGRLRLLLHEGGRLRCLVVKILEHSERLRDGRLRLLRILDGCCVLHLF